MAGRKYYVMCDSNCKFESMNKEQIITAITQAVNEGTIGDIDTGFVTTIKTINGTPLKFFVGTQYEYEALTEADKVNLFAIITNDTNKESIIEAIQLISNNLEGLETTLRDGSFVVENAKNATHAESATTATKATSATKADSATKATSATKADSATTATKADSATTATRATRAGCVYATAQSITIPQGANGVAVNLDSMSVYSFRCVGMGTNYILHIGNEKDMISYSARSYSTENCYLVYDGSVLYMRANDGTNSENKVELEYVKIAEYEIGS